MSKEYDALHENKCTIAHIYIYIYAYIYAFTFT